MTLLLAAIGILAGILTTLSGQGGGLFLLLVCSFVLGPHRALAITSPALLLGNLHRSILFRRAIDRPIAKRLILGAAPGAVLGGLLVGVFPAWVVQVLLVALTAMAIVKALGAFAFVLPRSALVPSGLVVGTMTGTSGGAGVLLAPILFSCGLSGNAYVGTSALVAVAMHAGRIFSYASGGLFSRDQLASTAVVAVAIFAGNSIGERIRRRIPDRRMKAIEYGTLVVCVALSVAGLG